MSFADAVKNGLSNYVLFTGRARRSEYWYFALFYFLVLIVAAILDGIIGTYPLLYAVAALGLFLPNLGLSIRRLHDTGRSGWFILLGLIPIVGPIILIVWYCSDSGPDNQYGPNPKGMGMGAGPGAAYPGYPA